MGGAIRVIIDKCKRGRQGIVTVTRTTTRIEEDPEFEPTEYLDGSEIWWKWQAETETILESGFVPLRIVNEVLGYSPNYNLRGFGDYKSGLKKLTTSEFDALLNYYRDHRFEDPTHPTFPRGRPPSHSYGGQESEAHRMLKERVAEFPSRYLGEEGLTTVRLEYPFPTNDRADIVLQDSFGRIIGVEIELHVSENQVEGVLQAIKYRHMLAVMFQKPFIESRSMLVAKSIAPEIKSVCDSYEVEYLEIP